jgi:monoamine oxidase
MPQKGRSCIIIGAGLAGLAAALRLVERGWTVDIFEAFPLIGGRVQTFHFQDQAPELNCELGGEWIGEHHERMRALCAQFQLPLQDHRYAFAFPDKSGQEPAPFFPAGAWPFRPESEPKLKQFLSDFKNPAIYSLRRQKELDQYDWWSWLLKLGFSHRDLWRRDLMDSTDFGETIRLASAYIAAGEYSASNDYDEMDSKVIGGNHLLPEAMLGRILQDGTSSLHLSHLVTEVHQGPANVEVRARHYVPLFHGELEIPEGPEISRTADFCICAIPARTVNRIHWIPALPVEQAAAADELQYCRIMKTVVLYEERFWMNSASQPTGGGYSWFTEGVSDFCFESTQGQNGPRGILCSYAIGDKADDLARASLPDLQRWITDDIAEACGLPKGSGTPRDIKAIPWQLNPFSQGAYAFYRCGQWFRVRSLLAQTHLGVHFAGEHLDEEWQGFMEGAVRTGEAAAARI